MLLNWYAVYTKPRWEKKVAESLTKKKFENYCPLNKKVKQWSDRKKIVSEPLFTSYVFIRVSESQLPEIKKVDGIINVVCWLNKPAIIKDAEIDLIKQFLNEHQSVQLQKVDINVNDIVRVISGPFMGDEGKVIALQRKSVKLILPSLGFVMTAEIQIGNVEIISSATVSPQKLKDYNYASN